MLVGPTMAGKTAAYRTLARAMGALAAASNSGFERVRQNQTYTLAWPRVAATMH
jgi:hypothetical protein